MIAAVATVTFENEIYFENQIILEFHPPTEFARDTVLYIVVRSLSSELNVIKPIKFWLGFHHHWPCVSVCGWL